MEGITVSLTVMAALSVLMLFVVKRMLRQAEQLHKQKQQENEN